jgi:glutathione S-transferase
MIKLYQFACSHFCEEAHRAREYKRAAYQPVSLLPGFHLKPMRLPDLRRRRFLF